MTKKNAHQSRFLEAPLVGKRTASLEMSFGIFQKHFSYVAVFGAAAGGRLQRRNDAGRGLAVVSVGDL